MAINVYNPEGIETIENSLVMLIPSAAKLNAITSSELQAGHEITCALKEFESSSDASESEDKRICRRDAKKRPGPVTHSLSDTEIILKDPQGEDELITGLEPGAHFVIVEFPNVKPGTDSLTSKKYYAWAVTVRTKVPGKISTDDGELFTMKVGWSVGDRTLNGTVTG